MEILRQISKSNIFIIERLGRERSETADKAASVSFNIHAIIGFTALILIRVIKCQNNNRNGRAIHTI